MQTKLLIFLFSFSMLSACAPHNHHSSHPNKSRASAKTSVVLQQEHDKGKIIIITHPPAAGRKCWPHQKHWHCRGQH
mgnify:CR=1 FL=1